MKKTLLRTKDGRWCELEVELKDGRLSICGSEGRIVRFNEAKREARQYWESYFEDDKTALGDMAVRFGSRTPKTAARKVLEIDGAYHGLDVHTTRTADVLITESCGQIRETLAEWFPEVAPYLQYHLNDMHVGTVAQEAELAKHTWNRTGSYYDWACVRLRDANLLYDPSYRVEGKPYKYGSGWLKRDLPADVVQWFKSLDGKVAA